MAVRGHQMKEKLTFEDLTPGIVWLQSVSRREKGRKIDYFISYVDTRRGYIEKSKWQSHGPGTDPGSWRGRALSATPGMDPGADTLAQDRERA